MKIAIIGEAWGAEEEKEWKASGIIEPFIGAAGYHLTKMLAEAGISRADCFLTNVFNLRPKANRIEALCGAKHNAIPGYPALTKGKYIRKEFEPELIRLADELIECDPNVIILTGNTPMWALLGRTTISKFRGTTDTSTHTVTGFKALPSYHPAAVLRDWSLRPIVIADFIKAERESHFPELRYPTREIWIEPTLEDLYEFKRLFIDGNPRLAVDIETAGQQITCVGFAPTRMCGIVVPFATRGGKKGRYWQSERNEYEAWMFIKHILADRTIAKTFQNGLYDIAFLWRAMGIKVINAEHDTMLMHHALQPESLKGLGFLGSIYTDERAWKHMRTEHKTIKRDD